MEVGFGVCEGKMLASVMEGVLQLLVVSKAGFLSYHGRREHVAVYGKCSIAASKVFV